MSTVRELHDKAMELAQEAMVFRQSGQLSDAENLARQAYQLEQQAAELVPEGQDSEPTRSILYLSAASLAYQAGEYDIALGLVEKGLSGFPPQQVEQELHNLRGSIREAFNQRALKYSRSGEYQHAIEDATKAIEIEPSPASFAARGTAYFGLGQYDEARTDLDQLLQYFSEEEFA